MIGFSRSHSMLVKSLYAIENRLILLWLGHIMRSQSFRRGQKTLKFQSSGMLSSSLYYVNILMHAPNQLIIFGLTGKNMLMRPMASVVLFHHVVNENNPLTLKIVRPYPLRLFFCKKFLLFKKKSNLIKIVPLTSYQLKFRKSLLFSTERQRPVFKSHIVAKKQSINNKNNVVKALKTNTFKVFYV